MANRSTEFEKLLQTHAPRLRRFVTSTMSDNSLVDDVVQDVLVTAWKKFSIVEQLEPHRVFAWLCGVAVRHMSNERRSATRRLKRINRASTDRSTMSPSSTFDQLVTLSYDLRLALLRIPMESRMLLLLVLWDDAGPDEIADVFDCSRDAASKRIQRAMTLLRQEYQYEK